MSGQTWDNAGTGGASLDATLGSSASADSNDPLFLAHPGDNGGNYVYVPGSNADEITVPDEAALDITGDIDLRAYVALDDWTPAQQGTLIGKWSTNQLSYIMTIQPGGTVRLQWTTDGLSGTNQSRTSTVATGITDGTAKWIRATLDVDNGSSQHDVKFFTSDDGSTWTQLGTTVTTAGTTSIHAGTSTLAFGGAGVGSVWLAGKLYRAQVFNGIDGTKVLDIDTSVVTSGASTTFTALTGQTASILRVSAADQRRSTVVVAPVWLFGADDYFEIADNASLDFGATDSFTLVAVTREHATYGTNDVYIAKKADTTNTTQGYLLANGATNGNIPQAQIGDGTNGLTIDSSSAVVSGRLRVHSFVRNTQTDTAQLYLDKVQVASATDNTTGSLANSEAFRIGRLSGAGTEYNAMELFAVAVFNRALTQPEIDSIVDYYQGKIPG